MWCACCTSIGSLPSSVMTGLNIRTVDVKANRLTVLPDNWVSGSGIPVNSTLVNFRISYNSFQACTHMPQWS